MKTAVGIISVERVLERRHHVLVWNTGVVSEAHTSEEMESLAGCSLISVLEAFTE